MSYADEGRSGSNTAVIVVSIIGGILILGLLVCGGLFFVVFKAMKPMMEEMKNMAEDVTQSTMLARQFLNDLHDKRFDDAYDMMSEDFQRRLSREKLEEMVRQHPEFTTATPIDQNRLEPQMDQAKAKGKGKGFEALKFREFVYRFHDKSGKEGVARLKLAGEDGELKVDDFAFDTPGENESRSSARSTFRSTRRGTARQPASTAKRPGGDDDDKEP
jgi:hypothetical protein